MGTANLTNHVLIDNNILKQKRPAKAALLNVLLTGENSFLRSSRNSWTKKCLPIYG